MLLVLIYVYLFIWLCSTDTISKILLGNLIIRILELVQN